MTLGLGLSSIFLQGVTDMAAGRFVLLGKLIGADFNSTADQPITLTQPGTGAWVISSIMLTNASTSLTAAKGTFYAAASKVNIMLPNSSTTTAYGGLVAPTDSMSLGVISSTNNNVGSLHFSYQTSATSSATIYLSLTTPQGAAATVDIYVFGYDLS